MTKANKALGMWDALALTVGSMVGAGIFSVLALTVKTAGPAAVISWVMVVTISFPMALTFSDLTGVLAESGGPYIYLRKRIGVRASLWVAWAFLWSAFGAAEALFMAMNGMLREMHLPHAFWLGTGILAVLGVVAGRGIHMGARVGRTLTVGTVTLLLFCIVVGFLHAFSGNLGKSMLPLGRAETGGLLPFHAWFPHGLWAVLPATFFAFWTYSGWEAVAVPSSSYSHPRALGKGMLLGSILVGVLYVFVALAGVLAVPASQLANSMNPLVGVARLAGPWAGAVVAWGAIVVVVGSLLSWLIATSALVQSLMRDGLLPAPRDLRLYRGEYHPGVVGILFVLFVAVAKLPLFTYMVAASSMTALVAYAVVFGAVMVDPQAHWPGMLKTLRRRRLSAALALIMTLLLIWFSGWNNIWPTLVLVGLGGLVVGVQDVRRQLRKVSDKISHQ